MGPTCDLIFILLASVVFFGRFPTEAGGAGGCNAGSRSGASRAGDVYGQPLEGLREDGRLLEWDSVRTAEAQWDGGHVHNLPIELDAVLLCRARLSAMYGSGAHDVRVRQ